MRDPTIWPYCSINGITAPKGAPDVLWGRGGKDPPIPDISLLDLVIPGMAGWKFLSELENLFGALTPIIIIV